MSWNDPCTYCGESRADCSCGHWGGIKPIEEDEVKTQLIKENLKKNSYWIVKTYGDNYKEKYLIYPDYPEHPNNKERNEK
ncbi:MAG: hypothetical protein ACRCXT_04435 [Paraclostridium sp.]